MPFVQGHLRNQSLSISFRTECAHCAQPVQLEIDSRLGYRVQDADDLLIFLPLVNVQKLKDPSIIHAF
jgi:hypothetical protein